MVEKELRDAIKAFKKAVKAVDVKKDDKKRLTTALDELMDLMATPGDREAKRVVEQPLPTGQIPNPKMGDFTATG